ncbi:MFS transporter [Arenibaculum pallidiluteum]|uniref:MFS transporter n=1 Tax=Arenibaculum pallidiluteum TaxID=2812559 RepID=UPI001A96E43D|nr:MFS transporter [Arenibaculum pallidiluteum]
MTPDAAGKPVASTRTTASPTLTWGAVALVLTAINLRPALTSLGPVLVDAMRDTGMSTATAGALSTVPVLCLGVFGLLAPRLARRFGMERTVFAMLLVLALGLSLRAIPSVPALLAGAVVAGAGIGVAGVLLPGIVKRDFPGRASLMIGVYTMALVGGATLAAGLTVPLAQALDNRWNAALALWALPALMAALPWLPLVRHPAPAAAPGAGSIGALWRDPLAWQVTLFMGLQSSLAYIVFAWLAPVLRERGFDPLAAGFAASIAVALQIPSSFLTPMLAAGRRRQGGTAVTMLGLSLAGMMGCMFGPTAIVWLSAAVLGLGLGGLFATALLLLVLRAPDTQAAAALSAMAQSFGYALASLGPLAFGLLHGSPGDWTAAGALFAAITLVAAGFGLAAGRDRRVGVPRPGPAP